MGDNSEQIGEDISDNGGSPSNERSRSSILEDKGCQIVLGVLLAVAVLWLAILYIGIPVALIGGAVAIYYYRSAALRSEDDAAVRKMRDGAILLAVGSAVLALASIAGNYFSDDAPYHSFLHGEKAETLDPMNEEE